MKLKTPGLALSLTLLILLANLPVAALAAEGIAKIDLCTETGSSAGSGWTWDGAKKILTLENCNLTFKGDGFHLPTGTKILVKGKNTLIAGADHKAGTAIFVNNGTSMSGHLPGATTLTIKSEDNSTRGSLTVACAHVDDSLTSSGNATWSRNGTIQLWGYDGQSADSRLTITGVDITVAGENNGIRGPSVWVDDASIQVAPSSHGAPDDYILYADKDILIANGSKITGNIRNSTWGIIAQTDLTIKDSAVSVTETVDVPSTRPDLAYSHYALQGTNNVTITDSSVDIQMTMEPEAISAQESADVSGIVAGYDGAITISGSTVEVRTANHSQDVNAYTYGIVNYGGDIVIEKDSRVDVAVSETSEAIGIMAVGNCTVDGSKATASAVSGTPDGFALEMLSYGRFQLLGGVEVIQGTLYQFDGEENITQSDEASLVAGTAAGGTSIIWLRQVPHPVAVKNSYAAETGAGSYTAGETVRVSAGSRPGYVFAGWTVDSPSTLQFDRNKAEVAFVMPDEPVTLTANWSVPEVPKTGDTGMPALWLGLMTLAGIGLAFLIPLVRKTHD